MISIPLLTLLIVRFDDLYDRLHLLYLALGAQLLQTLECLDVLLPLELPLSTNPNFHPLDQRLHLVHEIEGADGLLETLVGVELLVLGEAVVNRVLLHQHLALDCSVFDDYFALEMVKRVLRAQLHEK